MTVSINDIAKALNISFSYVCKVLNNDPNFRPAKETKELILKKAKEMKYDFSRIKHFRRRKIERIKVNIPAEIIIRSLNRDKVFDKGKITIRNINEKGILVTDIKLKKNCIPLKPFICELRIFKGKLKGINFLAEPVRVGISDNIHLGLVFAGLPEKHRERILNLK